MTMEAKLINQVPGVASIGSRIKDYLSNRSGFQSAKFLVAYASWSGIGFLKDELESFYANGNQLSFIIGIDGGITTSEPLIFLCERFPAASAYVFHIKHNAVTFHPKVYFFEGPERIALIVGSGNLTLGGLHNNFEVASELILSKNDPSDKSLIKEVKSAWEFYEKTKPPLRRNHLKKVDNEWIRNHLDYFGKQLHNRKITSKIKGFASLEFEIPHIVPFPYKAIVREKTINSLFTVNHYGNLLLLEIGFETGFGGTQIQLPSEVVREFFSASTRSASNVYLEFPKAAIRRATLTHFNNNTHRITMPEFQHLGRPCLLVMSRDAQRKDLYHCQILQNENYKISLKKCQQKVREGAKRWQIL
jgi:HKD family nuclease